MVAGVILPVDAVVEVTSWLVSGSEVQFTAESLAADTLSAFCPNDPSTY
jgi:hypothetical protein